jgi:hypothetical protein
MEFRTLPHEITNENFKMLAKAMSGDMVFSLSQTTATPLVSECTAGDVVYDITISLVTAAGELHSWYNGEVLLAIEDNNGTLVAAISPAAGEHKMTNGQLTVTVTLPKAVWTAGNTATLTVSDPVAAGTGICGWAVADKTFVATVTAD